MASTRVRRTQAERTGRTRAALLDATLDALVELGYKATTTTEVARRAGVSLGAVLHHFPTKADLLAAAVGHACDRRLAEFRRVMDEVGAAEDRLDAAIDLMWSMFQGPTYTAFVELWVAARTDPELAAALTAIDREFDEAAAELYAELFPEVQGAGEVGRAGLNMSFALLGGLAMSRMIDGYTPYPPDSIIAAYKGLIRLGLDALQPPGSQGDDAR